MIDLNILTELCDKLGCRITPECSLSEYITFKFGGPCRALIKVNSAVSAAELLRYLRDNSIKYGIIGRGSNIIAADEGFDGVILLFGSDFANIKVDGDTIRCDAGASLASACCHAQQEGLTGMENLFGIPGTVGGAIVMNAGAFDGEMSMVVTGVEAVTKEGEPIYVSPHSLRFGYRRSEVRKTGITVTKVEFTLKKGDREEIENRMNELKNRRVEKQPLEYPSAGSTFKRPEGYFAGKLISEAGLSGERIGGACVSPKHNGFIINDAGATAKDVNDLIELVKIRVYDTSNVKLEPAVIKVGRF